MPEWGALDARGVWAGVAVDVRDASAHFASTRRLSNLNGRVVLELRRGTQAANPDLLSTAGIAATRISALN
jgi:hypothetical protein